MSNFNRLLKNAHLRRSPHPSLLQRPFKYVSLLKIAGALHLGIFDQPEKNEFFNTLSKSIVTNKPKLLRFAMNPMRFMMGSEFHAVQETSALDRNVPRKPRLVSGVKGHNITENILPGPPCGR